MPFTAYTITPHKRAFNTLATTQTAARTNNRGKNPNYVYRNTNVAQSRCSSHLKRRSSHKKTPEFSSVELIIFAKCDQSVIIKFVQYRRFKIQSQTPIIESTNNAMGKITAAIPTTTRTTFAAVRALPLNSDAKYASKV